MIHINKISIKLGILFLVSILLVEASLFIFLYYGLLTNRIEDETDALLARANSHRNVLEKHYEDVTLDHVALMESEAETIVAITDKDKNVLVYSDSMNNLLREMINTKRNIPNKGILIEDRWRIKPYVAAASPIVISNQLKGYVYMFIDTESIRKVRNRLTFQFIVVGGFSILLTAITLFFLTRFITLPLIRMKKATEQMITGNRTVSLDVDRQDELGELARSIQTLSGDLDRLKKDRSDFFASIAHELRTPLTYLKGYAEIAQRPTIDDPARTHYLKIIKEESEHLTKLVTSLFDLAKLDQHSFTIHKQKVNIETLLNQIMEKVTPAYSEKGVLLVLDNVERGFIHVDPDRLTQVLLNLLDNSLRYTDPGKLVKVSVTEDKKEVCISVTDQGEGIPEENLPFIWDRLYRVDKSRSRKHGGTGLGLAIAKEIIERHGGEIGAKSKLGVGTTVTIRLKRGD